MKNLMVVMMFFGFLTLFTIACSKQEAKRIYRPLNEKNRIIDPIKFNSKLGSLDAHDNYAINVKKSALGELFIMRTALIDSIPNPTGNHLTPKIVYFKKNGNTVGLFELTDGHYDTSAIPTEVLLTTFPTIAENNETLTLDFGKGMNKLFYSGGTYSTDLSGGQDPTDDVYSINDSYVDRALIKNDTLYIDQFVRITTIEEGKQTNLAMRIKYNFQSYVFNKDFPSKLTTGQQKVGFFEVNPLIEPGSTQRKVKIAKWDIEKPITFYISRNTPSEMVRPITDAVLYWNKVLKEATGKEPLRVEMLPENIDLYTPGYNIIQWMDNDAAGAAYADIEADPLTGEILRTNVYMPSVFGTYAAKDAASTSDEFEANAKLKQGKTLLLKNFKSSRFMESYDALEIVKDRHSQMQAMAFETKKKDKAIDPLIISRFRDDSVRETVAHEIGHCIGLRHNFAASTETNVNTENYDRLTKSYFLTGIVPNNLKSVSTLMDYELAMFAAMTGGSIRLGLPPLSYDVAAVKWGYTDAQASKVNFGAFCTDGVLITKLYSDCKQFDQFKNPTEGNFFAYNQKIRRLAFNLAKAFGDVLNDEETTDKISALKKVSLSPITTTKSIIKSLTATFDTINPTSQSLATLAQFGDVNYYNMKDYLEATNTFKRDSINAIGGLAKLAITDYTPELGTFGFTIPVVEKVRNLFNKNIENLYGNQISAAEQAAINEAAERFFKALTQEVLTSHATLLNDVTFFEIDENFPEALRNYADKILFSKGTEELVRSVDGSKVILKPFFDNVRTDADLRAQVVLTTTHNFFPAAASYEEDMAILSADLWTNFLNDRNQITEDLRPNRKALDWLRTELKRFVPIAPQ